MKKPGRILYWFYKNRYSCLIAAKKKGEAMIAVLCIMAVILALCLSLLLGSYQMFASVNDSTQDEKYYQQALSFSEALQKKILDKTTYDSGKSTAENFIIGFMSDNTNYKVTQGVPIMLTFNATSSDSNYGNVRLMLTKEDIGLSTADTQSNNGWTESIEYYLVVNVQILDSSGKERADVSTKYDFTYSNSSYTYTCNDQDVTVSSVKDNDNLLSINGIEVKISTLKKNFGKYTEADGTVIQITRSPGLKQVYKFTSMGTI